MKIKLSEDFKDFVRMVDEIQGVKSKIDLEATYEVVREDKRKGLIYIISEGVEEPLPESGYVVMED